MPKPWRKPGRIVAPVEAGSRARLRDGKTRRCKLRLALAKSNGTARSEAQRSLTVNARGPNLERTAKELPARPSANRYQLRPLRLDLVSAPLDSACNRRR